jgi:SAM-dependent methyltransferase
MADATLSPATRTTRPAATINERKPPAAGELGVTGGDHSAAAPAIPALQSTPPQGGALSEALHSDPTERFSDRVADYARYRPGYPPAVVETLAAEAGLTPASAVADVGSGTGLSAEPFLALGCAVVGVEPNARMRAAAEQRLARHPRFESVTGTAEATGLPEGSADFVVSAQAFHWFDRRAARREFGRILRPGGSVVLLWNSRGAASTPLLADYEALLLRFGTDYRQVVRSYLGEPEVRAFFAPGPCRRRTFPAEQVFDLEGLTGRLLSASYVPAPGHPDHRPMLEELERIFARHQQGGHVRFPFECELYWGRLAA